MKLKKDKLYHIEWLDHSSNSEWQSMEDIAKWSKENKPCVSEGRLCLEDKDVIILYLDNTDDSFACLTMIYKINIIKIKRL